MVFACALPADVSSFYARIVTWTKYVALGDSFTEGMVDEVGPDGRYIGWADRVAAHLTAHEPALRYANLAIRGKLLPEIVDEQVPDAIAMRPDLVSIAGGVNDAMRRGFDLDRTATRLEDAVRALRGTGADVLLVAFGDPGRRSRVFGAMRDRLRALNSATRAIADAHGCFLVDFWGAAVFDPDDMWGEDRLHLSPEGHIRAAQAALEALGMGSDDWRVPGLWARNPPIAASREHLAWFGRHGAPWVVRRLRGQSSGAGITPKRPTLSPIDPQVIDGGSVPHRLR